ncbi:hypothetical protein [Aurantiacibacter hainanensis]|uniref:hypothetical protein n=1 Tax=Aurantiacibacter hainanensis TaxID=3076114 RepID=UPI0030C6E7D5
MARSEEPTPPPSATETDSQDALALDALAKAVLAREIRPRASSVRRLAEGVLSLQQDVKKARKKARKATKPAKKNKKLAKIPGQKKGK